MLPSFLKLRKLLSAKRFPLAQHQTTHTQLPSADQREYPGEGGNGRKTPFVYLSPARVIPTELIRTYLETRRLAPTRILDGHNGHPKENDVVLHNGNHKLTPLKPERRPVYRLIVYQEGWHILDMAFWRKYGACGWLDLQDDPDEFKTLIREALDGKTPLATSSVRPHLPHLEKFVDRQLGKKLTRRELEVSSRLLRGMTDKEIGKQLGITAGTTHNHRKAIYRKLGVRSIPQLILRLRTYDQP